jgi:phosphoglycolate phosphatase
MPGASRLAERRARGIVFDLDGTLVDGYAGIASGVNAARASFGLPPLSEGDVRGRVGRGLSHLMDDVVGPQRSAAGAAIFRTVYDRVCVEQTRPIPGVDATLRALGHRGFRLSVASNKPAPYSIRILERLGWLPLFDAIEGPETAGALKPDPAMIRRCLAAMGISAGDAVYVGDMAIDAEAGARAGVPVVLVRGGSSGEAALHLTGRPVVETLAELLEMLPAPSSGQRGT